jgi:hypothetical protein
MGIEAFILPWLLTMAAVAVAGLVSIARRFGVVRYRDRYVAPPERDAAFWTKQLLKAAIVGFAVWQMYLILKRVV